MDIRYNPNGSVLAIEGITSKDGRISGKWLMMSVIVQIPLLMFRGIRIRRYLNRALNTFISHPEHREVF